MSLTPEQQERRKAGLFASDIARIMEGDGVCVALEKLGQREPEDLEEVREVKIGHKAESLIIDAYATLTRSGASIERTVPTLYHPELPWMGCHLDSRRPDRNIEAKAIGSYNRHLWGNEGTDQVPDYVLWQVQAQMTITGAMVTDIPVCFIGAQSLKHLFLEEPPPITLFYVPRDYELGEALIKKASHVRSCIEQGTTPAPENLQDIKSVYQRAVEKKVEATPELYVVWQKLVADKTLVKELEDQVDESKFKLQEYMKEADALILIQELTGLELVTWRNDSDGYKFDVKSFEKDHPDLYMQYLKDKPGPRKFLTKDPYKKKKRR